MRGGLDARTQARSARRPRVLILTPHASPTTTRGGKGVGDALGTLWRAHGRQRARRPQTVLFSVSMPLPPFRTPPPCHLHPTPTAPAPRYNNSPPRLSVLGRRRGSPEATPTEREMAALPWARPSSPVGGEDGGGGGKRPRGDGAMRWPHAGPKEERGRARAAAGGLRAPPHQQARGRGRPRRLRAASPPFLASGGGLPRSREGAGACPLRPLTAPRPPPCPPAGGEPRRAEPSAVDPAAAEGTLRGRGATRRGPS